MKNLAVTKAVKGDKAAAKQVKAVQDETKPERRKVEDYDPAWDAGKAVREIHETGLTQFAADMLQEGTTVVATASKIIADPKTGPVAYTFQVLKVAGDTAASKVVAGTAQEQQQQRKQARREVWRGLCAKFGVSVTYNLPKNAAGKVVTKTGPTENGEQFILAYAQQHTQAGLGDKSWSDPKMAALRQHLRQRFGRLARMYARKNELQLPKSLRGAETKSKAEGGGPKWRLADGSVRPYAGEGATLHIEDKDGAVAVTHAELVNRLIGEYGPDFCIELGQAAGKVAAKRKVA